MPSKPNITVDEFLKMSTEQRKALDHATWSRCMAEALAHGLNQPKTPELSHSEKIPL